MSIKFFELTDVGTVRKLWLEDNDKPELADDPINAARYRRAAAFAVVKRVLGSIEVDGAKISCPMSNQINVKKALVGGGVKVEKKMAHLWHSSVTFVDGEWSIRLWLDITKGRRRRHKEMPEARGLAWLDAAIGKWIDDWKAERLTTTYLNVMHTITPLVYCELSGKSPARFMPRMFEMNEKARFNKVYCQLAQSYAGWYINYCK